MRKHKKRVLFVTSGLGLGGAETMLYQMVRSFREQNGQEHFIVTLTDDCSFNFESIGVPVDLVDLRKAVNPLSGLSKLRKLIQHRRPDVIQGWMYHGNLASTLSSPPDIPIVWGIHHSLHDLKDEKLATRLSIKAGTFFSKRKNVQKIVFVSGRSQLHHCAYGYPIEKSIVIPNGFDFQIFAPDESARISIRHELGFDGGHVLIGNFSRYHPVKDHDLLLRAFAKVSSDIPSARMVLAGTGIGENNGKLVALIRTLGIADRVALLGLRNDMQRLYNALDLYVLSSKNESFPNVLGEASACGIPSITTDVGDAGHIIGDTGCVIPPSCIDALSDTLRKMMLLDSRERKTMGALARQRVIDRFGLPAMTRAYAEIYEELGVHTEKNR